MFELVLMQVTIIIVNIGSHLPKDVTRLRPFYLFTRINAIRLLVLRVKVTGRLFEKEKYKSGIKGISS